MASPSAQLQTASGTAGGEGAPGREPSSIDSSDILELNVGGRAFTTKRGTLTLVKDSLLAQMFSGRWECSLSLDREGRIFLDWDPDCFAVILHQLRLQQLTCETCSWSGRLAPEGQAPKYFEKLLDYLGLTSWEPIFGDCLEMALCDGGRRVQHLRSHRGTYGWAIGVDVLTSGKRSWVVEVHKFDSGWIAIGVIGGSASPHATRFYNDETLYAWGGDWKQVWIGGTHANGHGGWETFQRGDTVRLDLDMAAGSEGSLQMTVKRLGPKLFTLKLPQQEAWRIFVACRGAEDSFELHPAAPA